MALQGTLDTFALPDVLRLLAATKKSGRLRITGSRGTGSAWVAQGEIVAVEATHAPHATEPVDALFELLRFEEGAFTFDAEATHDAPRPPIDVELLVSDADALLAEWRTIEAVVPSMDAWVTLRPDLPQGEVAIDQASWTTVVAVGAGATVRRIADELCLAELPVSRAICELVDLGVARIEASAPAGAGSAAAPAERERPLLASATPAEEPVDEEPPVPAARAPRARRAKAVSTEPAEPERFVPLELPGHMTASYDEPKVEVHEDPPAVDDLAAAFPGLANRLGTEEPTEDDAELARQLATLSPRAADAVRAAAQAETDEERDAALSAVDGDDEPLNRGLLLKFLSSVKS